MMIEYQDIRMEGRVVTEALQLFFSRCLTNNGIFSFGHLFFPLVHWDVGRQVPFYRQESSPGINDHSEHHSNKPARLNPCNPRLLRGPSSSSPAHELSMIKYVLLVFKVVCSHGADQRKAIFRLRMASFTKRVFFFPAPVSFKSSIVFF